MAETLIGSSIVLLFGRLVKDLVYGLPSEADVDAATTEHMQNLRGLGPIDGFPLAPGNSVLVRKQKNHGENGIYRVAAGNNNPWNKTDDQPAQGAILKVANGDTLAGSWERMPGNPNHFKFRHLGARRRGKNSFLERQSEGMVIARIYGFSYEGHYYDLPRTILFGVHGDGEPAVVPSHIVGAATTEANLSRAPQEPSSTGVAAADFQFSDDIRVWSYDKADYTIRMDVETGMFEQVLLEAYFSDAPPVSGMRVSGMHVGGMRVSGMHVGGMRVSGMRVGGARGRGDTGD